MEQVQAAGGRPGHLLAGTDYCREAGREDRLVQGGRQGGQVTCWDGLAHCQQVGGVHCLPGQYALHTNSYNLHTVDCTLHKAS